MPRLARLDAPGVLHHIMIRGIELSFNRRHKRHGQLFQNRYKSIVCQERVYLRELVRYIHLNPLREGIVSTLKPGRNVGHLAPSSNQAP